MSQKRHEADVAFIEALAKLLRDNDLNEIEVDREYGENDSLNVRVARGSTVVQTVAAAAPAAAAPAPVAATATAAAAPAAADNPADLPGIVTSPMVGTVYLQAEPGVPAFVKVGDTVKEGQTILIVEAMKTMNQIPAPHSGTVQRILVEDGSPVEYGAPLMVIA